MKNVMGEPINSLTLELLKWAKREGFAAIRILSGNMDPILAWKTRFSEPVILVPNGDYLWRWLDQGTYDIRTDKWERMDLA